VPVLCDPQIHRFWNVHAMKEFRVMGEVGFSETHEGGQTMAEEGNR
jgi:hypothetical protein